MNDYLLNEKINGWQEWINLKKDFSTILKSYQRDLFYFDQIS